MSSNYICSNECIAYSQFRQEWRENYKNISNEIREKRKYIAECYRDGKPHSASDGQSRLSGLRCEARNANRALSERRTAWYNLLAEGHEWHTLKQALAAE